MSASRAERIAKVKKHFKTFPDWPKPGIMFRDMFPVFRSPEIVAEITSLFEEIVRETCSKVDVIVGLDARGFLFGPLLAQRLGTSFVPVRKRGKLPGPTIKETYVLEYGEDCFEMQEGSILPGENALIIDDLIATGGTMNAACSLVKKQQGNVVLCLVLIELVDLKGRDKVPAKLLSLVEYEGE
ncbi:unnamed protein product [Owenia fusiformis]|uniref:Adenine phosphoribosyltransferase n=1 Tax=Owenia fusiformis TaxID=6347 RepID=A0A8J1UU68_OWEFU|nr:unnamed protein product [Owenia fusiformis]